MTKRGEPLPINGALNRPRTKLGLELSAWMSIVFVTVTVFLAGKGPDPWPNKYLVAQVAEARKVAEAHGFRNVKAVDVPGKAHGPLADEVLTYFDSLRRAK